MSNGKNKDTGGFLAPMRNSIIAGLFIIIPLFITIWLTYKIYSILTSWSVQVAAQIPLLHSHQSEFWFMQIIRLTSLILMLAILFIIGQLASYKFGKFLIRLTEWGVKKVPVLNTIYSTTQQIGEAMWSAKGGMFRQVVLIEYPRKGIYSIGFLTNENRDDFEIKQKLDRDMLSIFVPTTPNPTGGFLLFLPREDCIFLDMKVKDAMRLIISGGAVASDEDARKFEKLKEADGDASQSIDSEIQDIEKEFEKE